MTPHLCPICNQPMKAETIESPNVNPRGTTEVWHCTNPKCYDALQEQYGRFADEEIANPYLIRYENPKEVEQGYLAVHLGSMSNPEVAKYHFCPFCDNQVELLDSVYYIWNCPNCLLVRCGGMIVRFYPIIDGEADLEHEIIEQRRGVPMWSPFAPLEDDENDEEEVEE